MPVYEYKGRNNRTQAIVAGEQTANDAVLVAAQLRKEGITPVYIREKKVTINIAKRSPKGVPLKEVALFSRQLAIMLDAGLPLVQGLRILAEQTPNRTFQSNLTDVYTDVEQGSSLSEAMRKHPRTFDNLYTNMIAAGEAGGILDTILKRLTAYAKKSLN